ncbi:MAG: peptide ABC transporter ATP-binding protein, partial [Gemmatimonadetes bacterium]|nr:peptide ABC transporter ATP-binding protein [Gemmatimonadota bacterium]
ALISAVPVADPAVQKKRKRIALPGDVPDPASPPKGCYFHPRCRYATDLCRESDPPLKTYPGGVEAACHYSDTLSLQGI